MAQPVKDEEDFLQLKNVFADIRLIYGPIIATQKDQVIQIIKSNDIGNDRANAINAYLTNFSGNMEKIRKLVDTLCAKDQFKNDAEYREIKNFSHALTRHFADIQAVAHKGKI